MGCMSIGGVTVSKAAVPETERLGQRESSVSRSDTERSVVWSNEASAIVGGAFDGRSGLKKG
jgi:hypothetical protein